jgi:hypothetical protein
MNPKIEKITSKLNDDLLGENQIPNPLEKLTVILRTIEQAISELRQFVKNEHFQNDKEEIEFFKNVRPGILALRIEQGLRYNLTVNKPISTNALQLKYYEEELRALESFFRMNNFYYQYYKNGFTELDTLYFLRNAGPLTVPLAEVTEWDSEFSTPMSFLFSKFIAYERMQYFLLEQMSMLINPSITHRVKSNDDNMELKWTGDVINLIELAYGIWLTGQINNGNVSLNQIVRWLEKNLSVSIGIVQRRFAEIERRKRLSITKFIDQMREAILKKIDKGNS